jgi:hypothetical protein
MVQIYSAVLVVSFPVGSWFSLPGMLMFSQMGLLLLSLFDDSFRQAIPENAVSLAKTGVRRNSFGDPVGRTCEGLVIHSYAGQVGKILPISRPREIEAIALIAEVPFEFRLLRNGEPGRFPLALEQLAEWQAFDPIHQRACYSTLYPIQGGTRGVDATGLALDTRGLLVGSAFSFLTWDRH